jgi:hypothetical protein
VKLEGQRRKRKVKRKTYHIVKNAKITEEQEEQVEERELEGEVQREERRKEKEDLPNGQKCGARRRNRSESEGEEKRENLPNIKKCEKY